jgi:hypothetical protein
MMRIAPSASSSTAHTSLSRFLPPRMATPLPCLCGDFGVEPLPLGWLSYRGLETEVNLLLMDGSTLRDYFTDAIKFWEPWRVIYNLVLAAILIMYLAKRVTLPRNPCLPYDLFIGLFLLAVAANVAYCAAYLVASSPSLWLPRSLAVLALGTLGDRNHVRRGDYPLHGDGYVPPGSAMTLPQ